jgi:glucose/arabinose dehydrogenase
VTRRLAAAVVLATLLAGACSSVGDGSGPSSTTSSTTTASSAPGATTAPARPDLAAVDLKVTEIGRFDQPLDLKWCAGHDDPFVVEKTGRIRNFRTRQVILDVSAEIATAGEQGLLGMACDRSGDSLFVNYTSNGQRQDRVDRFAMPAGGAAVDRSTRRNVLAVDDPAANHNGGAMVLGPDGFIWYGLGDGGGRNDQFGNGQNPRSLLAKVLRIDPASGEVSVAVSGMRNPWRLSFDRATGDLWIGDVGQNRLEEIDLLRAGAIIGANGGWPLFESTARLAGGADPGNLLAPVYEYGRDEGQAVTGGYVYRGAAIPSLAGAYLFADGITARLRAIVVEGDEVTQERVFDAEVPPVLASFAEDPDGELYAVSLDGGVYRIEPG